MSTFSHTLSLPYALPICFRYIPSRCSWITKQVRDDRKRTNRSLARPPFLPEPVPIGQPLGDLHFKAARQRGVEALRLHLFRRSEEHTSELQSLMRISYDVFCFQKKKSKHSILTTN